MSVDTDYSDVLVLVLQRYQDGRGRQVRTFCPLSLTVHQRLLYGADAPWHTLRGQTRHLLRKEEAAQRSESPPIAYVACDLWPPCAVCARITGTEGISNPTRQVRHQTARTTLLPQPVADSGPKTVLSSQYPQPFPPLPPPFFFTPISMPHSKNGPTDMPPNVNQHSLGYPMCVTLFSFSCASSQLMNKLLHIKPK